MMNNNSQDHMDCFDAGLGDDLNLHDVHHLQGDNFFKPSCDPTGVAQEEVILSRSIKIPKADFQISFEETFLSEHIEAFEKQVQNFVESCSSGCKTLSEIYPGEMDSTCFDMMESSLFPGAQQRAQFKKDLEREEKLNDLLKKVCGMVPQVAAHEFTYLAWVAWEKYLEIRKKTLSISDLSKAALQLAETHSKTLFSGHDFQALNLALLKETGMAITEEQEQAFQKLCQFWYETVLLVVEEYFQNPWCETSVKRERTMDLDELSIWDDISNSSPLHYTPCKRMTEFQDE